MALTFEQAFDRVIGHEGRFQDNYHDRGNWATGEVGKGRLKGTKYGISAMSYPEEDIENLTLEQAKSIYYRDFWLKAKGDELPNCLSYQLFDASVNHGIGNAIRMLQRAVGVADDGDVGPRTLGAVGFMPTDDVLKFFLAERLEFMTKVSSWHTFSKGWSRRIAQNLRYGAYDTEAPWYTQVEVVE